jgi:glycerol-3-phosphate dehydrogenase
MNRKNALEQFQMTETWDIVVIGGGATGLGIGLDSALRGYSTLVLEKGDFSQGTSSRSTKLVHGGVRYLKQGNISLVLEALKERGLLLKNAPHLVHNQDFIIPFYTWKEWLIYSIGLRLYDALSGKRSLGKSRNLNKKEILEILPGLITKELKGGIRYQDGQFDDSRLSIHLAQSAVDRGACVLNYMEVIGLEKGNSGKISGIEVFDHLNKKKFKINSRILINATGVFSDSIIKLDEPAAPHKIRPSQGIHLLVDQSFLRSNSALMIPETPDGRVLFAVPWHNRVILGTTDTPIETISLDPKPLKSEIDFILNTLALYWDHPPKYSDIKSIYAGLRPLAAGADNQGSTQEISRSHKIWASKSGLVHIIGGKWTTYRIMAEETLDFALKNSILNYKKGITENYPIHGYTLEKSADYLAIYGSDRSELLSMANAEEGLLDRIHPDFPFIYAEIIWSLRYEMAETLSDILSRRLRWLFLDAGIAREVAPKIVRLMARELNRDESWEEIQIQEFMEVSENYLAN